METRPDNDYSRLLKRMEAFQAELNDMLEDLIEDDPAYATERD